MILLTLLLSGCPASRDADDPDPDDPDPDDRGGDTGDGADQGHATVDGTLDGASFPPLRSAFWAELTDPPLLHTFGPAGEVSTGYWDTQEFADNGLSITVIATSMDDGCARLSDWYAVLSEQTEEMLDGDREAAAAVLDEEQVGLLDPEMWTVLQAWSTDDWDTVVGDYEVPLTSMLECGHQRELVDWSAAVHGGVVDVADWSWADTGESTVSEGSAGGGLASTTAAQFGSDEVTVTIEAVHCPALEQVLAASPWLER